MEAHMPRDPDIQGAGINGKPKIKTKNFTFDFWQTESGKPHERPKKWLIRQKD